MGFVKQGKLWHLGPLSSEWGLALIEFFLANLELECLISQAAAGSGQQAETARGGSWKSHLVAAGWAGHSMQWLVGSEFTEQLRAPLQRGRYWTPEQLAAGPRSATQVVVGSQQQWARR